MAGARGSKSSVSFQNKSVDLTFKWNYFELHHIKFLKTCKCYRLWHYLSTHVTGMYSVVSEYSLVVKKWCQTLWLNYRIKKKMNCAIPTLTIILDLLLDNNYFTGCCITCFLIYVILWHIELNPFFCIQ